MRNRAMWWSLAGAVLVLAACTEMTAGPGPDPTGPIAVTSEPVSGGGVVPIRMDDGPGGNATCAMVGDYEFSSERVNYEDGAFDASFPVGLSVTTDGTFVSFSSTFAIGAVIVKGGPASNVYVYDPAVFSDSNLASPVNASGNPAGLSNLTFCWNGGGDDPDPDPLVVTKTARGIKKMSFDWALDKSVVADRLAVDDEGSATFSYTVALTPTQLDDVLFVVGGISVHNPNADAATIVSIADVLADGTVADVTCAGWDQVDPFELVGGATLECTYEAMPATPAATNTVTVSTSGDIGGGSATVGVTYEYPENMGTYNGCVVVADDMGAGLPNWDDWTVLHDGVICAWDDPASFVLTYDITFTPGADDLDGATCGVAEYTNRAKLWLLGDQYRDDSVTVWVEVPCIEITAD